MAAIWLSHELCLHVIVQVLYYFRVNILPQVDIANKYVGYHAEQFGYSTPNTDFKLGEMEHLADVGIQDNSIGIIL